MSARTYRVGLTGGIASGKSTAAKFFGALGVPILDSDQIARDVVEPGQPPLERLVARFGPTILTADGHLDRPALRDIVFSDPKARADLEALTHPAIGAALEARSARPGAPTRFWSSRCWSRRTSARTLTGCWSWTAMKRCRSAACSRDGSTPQQAQAILDAQATRAARLKAADDVISNEADMSAVQKQVAALHARYLELAAQPRS